MKIVLASKNQHKLQEIKAILGNISGVTLVSLNDYPQAPDVIEDGKTFEANASKKALEMAEFTGETCIADDSGLEVDALHGEPGVYSARYAGPNGTYQDICLKLLKNLEGIPEKKRTAQFRTVIAVARPGKILGIVEGKCPGYITTEMRGKNGFGYDPVFYYPGLKKTFAELSAEEKNKVSHRFMALENFKNWLYLTINFMS